MSGKANRARIVAAIFTMALFYASMCSTTCAIGYCPNQVQRTAGHDCDQTPSHHSHPSHPQAPGNPDCSRHEHPGLFVAKSGDLSKFQLRVLGHLDASTPFNSSQQYMATSMTDAKASDHAPPLASSLPLYQQISVLRI
jgi:hypothetical protein